MENILERRGIKIEKVKMKIFNFLFKIAIAYKRKLITKSSALPYLENIIFLQNFTYYSFFFS